MVDWLLWVFLLVASPGDHCRTLDHLDTVRSHAWELGSSRMLQGLYQDEGVASGDVARLGEWTERGIRIRGMRFERRGCEVVSRPSAARVELEVDERLHAGAAVFADGSIRLLPDGSWQRRRIGLVHTGRWRIAAVEELG